MAGCSCSELPVSRTLTSRADFLRLAKCCRSVALFRSGRISVEVSSIDPPRRQAMEEQMNRLWQACGCGEAAVSMCAFIAIWFAGLHPLDAWREQASDISSALACVVFVVAGVSLVKLAAIVFAHRRLAMLLERQASALTSD